MEPTPTGMSEEAMWAAFASRSRAADGRFVVAVTSTGIFCRPSCPARRPRRENVVFFAEQDQARAAGYRPCLRCTPERVARDAAAVDKAVGLLGSDDPPALAALAEAVGYAPSHFLRLFRRETGLTPAQFARERRLARIPQALGASASVTEAIYAAGYAAPSRFYAQAGPALGMAPSAWRRGGAGVEIRWAVGQTSLGPVLVAATDKGICRLAFGEGEEALRRRFPKARLVAGGEALAPLLAAAVAACDDPAGAAELPLDVAGTEFQHAVWRELRRIPPGETRSYAEIAAAAGRPGAVRAAGSANGANPVAVLVPCHRVIRSDGTLGGYAYGLPIKRELLSRERKRAKPR